MYLRTFVTCTTLHKTDNKLPIDCAIKIEKPENILFSISSKSCLHNTVIF